MDNIFNSKGMINCHECGGDNITIAGTKTSQLYSPPSAEIQFLCIDCLKIFYLRVQNNPMYKDDRGVFWTIRVKLKNEDI